MKILIVNPIIYTSETRDIKKVNTIKDTMIYDLCLAFAQSGADVTLAAAEDYKPELQEEYPFRVVWMKTVLKRLCPPNTLPFCPQVKGLSKSGGYDLIITSEVFSLNSLSLAIHSPKNLIVWHELAKHNKIFKGIPSKIWYGVIAKIFFRKALIVPRSIEAKNFISRFCKNVSSTIIDHGVNLDKFIPCTEKENIFAVSSQLIGRKRIDKIIDAFAAYTDKYDGEARLYIMGDGEERERLQNQAKALCKEDSVIFTGRLSHRELVDYLRKAKAMLVYTEKDNNMVSVVESIAVGTPVITTSVPYNASYIKANSLGIVNDNWNEQDLAEISQNKAYAENCMAYREFISNQSKVKTFLKIYNEMQSAE